MEWEMDDELPSAPVSPTATAMDFGQLPMEVVIRYARKMHLLPAKLNPSAPPTTPYTPQPGTGTQQAMDTTGMERALSDNTSANSAFILNSFMDTVAVQHYTKSPQDYQKLLDICHLHYHQIEVAEKDILPWFVYSVHARDKVLKLHPPLSGMRTTAASTASTGTE